MEIKQEDLVKEFARRTKKNLEILEQIKKDSPSKKIEIYETTQQINSLLGLLVFPRERYYNDIPETPITELANMGWAIPKVIDGYPQATNLRELVSYIRHSIAHCNIEFLNQDNEISGLKVWNKKHGSKGRIIWKAEITIQDIKIFTDKLSELIEQN